MNRKKLNILQVVNSPHWHAISSYALGLSKGLKAKGHKVILLTLPKSLLIERAQAEGVPVITNLRLNHYNPIYFFKDVQRLIKILEEEEIDVLNVHESYGFAISCLAAKLAKRKIALIRTRGTFMSPKGHPINKYLHNSLTDKVIVTSQFMRQKCLKHLQGKETHYLLVYGGIDVEYLMPCEPNLSFKQGLGIERDAIVIGIIGRFDPVKGHRYFFEAAKEVKLKNKGIKVIFLVLGYPAEYTEDNLLMMAQSCGVKEETVIVKEWSDLSKMLSIIDIGVISSIDSEANSRSILEFMACGKPVVVTTIGVLPEIIEDNKTGFLVPPKQPEIMAEKILELVKDKEKREEMGLLARKLVEERFSQKDFVSKTEEIYYQAMEKR